MIWTKRLTQMANGSMSLRERNGGAGARCELDSDSNQPPKNPSLSRNASTARRCSVKLVKETITRLSLPSSANSSRVASIEEQQVSD